MLTIATLEWVLLLSVMDEELRGLRVLRVVDEELMGLSVVDEKLMR